MNIKTWTRRRKIVVSGAAAFLTLSAIGNMTEGTETAVSDPAPTQSVTATPAPTAEPTTTPEPTATPEPTEVPDPMVAAGWARATGDCDALQARYLGPKPNMSGARQVVFLDTLQLRGRELGCDWAMEDLGGGDLSRAETEPLSIASRVDD